MKNEDQILAAHFTWKAETDHAYLSVHLEIIFCKIKCALNLYEHCAQLNMVNPTLITSGHSTTSFNGASEGVCL